MCLKAGNDLRTKNEKHPPKAGDHVLKSRKSEKEVGTIVGEQLKLNYLCHTVAKRAKGTLGFMKRKQE